MSKTSFFRRLFILAIMVSSLCLTVLPQESDISFEMKKWEVISNQLRRFLDDPFAAYDEIRKIDDLFYWTNIYVEIYGGRYIEELFSRHFKVEDVDHRALNLIYYLLDKFSLPANNWEHAGIKPIVSRLVEIIKSRPDWFFKELVARPDWKKLLRLIALKRSADLKQCCAVISDPAIRTEVLNLLEELEEEKRTEVQRWEEFLQDPIANFDKIKNIYFLCSVMTVRDRMYVDENKNLPMGYFSPGAIADYIRENPDEQKIEILLHMISHCTTSGVESYVIVELGSEIFFEYPELFSRCLAKYRQWRSIVYLISVFLYYRDPGYNKIISSLGKSKFESELKSQLYFLGPLVEKKKEEREKAIAKK